MDETIKKPKINYWMYSTIAIIIVILILLGVLAYQYIQFRKVGEYDFNGVKINKVVFGNVMKQFESDKPLNLCDVKNKICVTFPNGYGVIEDNLR